MSEVLIKESVLKKFFVSIFVCVALSVFSPFNCLADGDRTVTILYSGDVLGHITPVHG